MWRFLFAHWGKGVRHPFPILKGHKEESVWKWRTVFQHYLNTLLDGERGKCNGFYRGLFQYEAGEGELSFKEGDILVILSKDDSGWWNAMNFSSDSPHQEGHIPSNYVEEFGAAQHSVPQNISLNNARFRAIYDYIAADGEELSFMVGEIFVGKHDREGWYYVENQNGVSGYVPNNYLEAI
jgi:hypothetical protein